MEERKLHGLQREIQANAADEAWSDHTGLRELSVDAKNSKNQQHKANFGRDNAGKKFLAGRKFKRRARRIFQGELSLGAVKSLDRAAVQLPYQFIRRIHDQIDHFPVQGFLLRVSAAFRDGLLRQRRVASASLRETPQERRGIVIDLLSECVDRKSTCLNSS